MQTLLGENHIIAILAEQRHLAADGLSNSASSASSASTQDQDPTPDQEPSQKQEHSQNSQNS